ncbi:class E sortase [Streptomyces litmocidini]|uniref:class E sortase n=1 Tax=Streptomyces litmocidini TaxID=67318 RepID=UPI0036FF57E1
MTVRLVVRSLSELCITAGALVVLFVAYLLYWTGVQADSAGAAQIDTLQREWAGTPVAAAPAPARVPAPYVTGRGFAVMYVPRFGRDWEWPVLEGTGPDVLKRGLGHYTRTAPLGTTGNFAVAGHRRTHGDPFKDFPRLRPGDAIVLTDGTTWFTYRIDRGPYRTVPGDTAVVDHVPRKSGFDGPGRYLTLTTCDPEWGSSHRLIVWAHLDAARPVTDGRPQALGS